jgi:hypothetical protein
VAGQQAELAEKCEDGVDAELAGARDALLTPRRIGRNKVKIRTLENEGCGTHRTFLPRNPVAAEASREHGRAAGLRTSILVTMAACVAMLQVNLLLPLAGRPSDSFIMNDLMRLPLGILSGMGFIGAGAIVRRENFVVGVTTAATLWFLTPQAR